MGQSLVQIYVHIVFSTKNRTPYLKERDARERLHAYLAGICKNQKCSALKIGGVEDHVHLLLRLGKTIAISTLIRELKRESSSWVKSELGIDEFYWQSGYGGFLDGSGKVQVSRFPAVFPFQIAQNIKPALQQISMETFK